MARTPTISFLEALDIEGRITIFSDNEFMVIPANNYYALIQDRENIIGAVYSATNGFPSFISKSPIKLKQYSAGSRPAILV